MLCQQHGGSLFQEPGRIISWSEQGVFRGKKIGGFLALPHVVSCRDDGNAAREDRVDLFPAYSKTFLCVFAIGHDKIGIRLLDEGREISEEGPQTWAPTTSPTIIT